MNPDPTAPADFVRLFTDGACRFNPGPGGWAFILQHPNSGKEIESSGAEADTTNNRMELMGVIRGLESLKRACHVNLVTDSKYVAQGIQEWMPKWKAQGWQRKEGKSLKPVSNLDLWQQMDALVSKHKITIQHVYGHTGHAENERCDKLAVDAYRNLTNTRSA